MKLKMMSRLSLEEIGNRGVLVNKDDAVTTTCNFTSVKDYGEDTQSTEKTLSLFSYKYACLNPSYSDIRFLKLVPLFIEALLHP